MPELSIIILSYNTSSLTQKTLDSLIQSLKSSTITSEIIVIDNGSTDGSIKLLESYRKNKFHQGIVYKCFLNKRNVGYPKGNNQGIKIAQGTHILFLNSDVIMRKMNFDKIIDEMNKHDDWGALTVRVNLSDGSIDPASHRGFPTLWSAFCYFMKLEKLLGTIPFVGKYFGGYHLTNLNLKEIHEIDSPTGAFFLTRRDILKKIKGFDATFFMYGEDLDLSYRIKELGYKIVYYPQYEVIHYKHSSGLKAQDPITRRRTRAYFYKAMKIFYRKHYKKRYPALLNYYIYTIIDFMSSLS